jgi:adenylosuccinate synthase
MAKAYLVAGLGWGDEAKGATVDALCRNLPVDLVVRYNGGCQAAHNVVTSEGVHHTFSQFGSGMLANNQVRTHLSRYVLVDPLAMMREAEALGRLTPQVWERTTVDGDAVIVTPFHRRLNRLRECARGAARHGSCGRGIGVAREMELKYPDDVLRARHRSDMSDGFARLLFSYSEIVEETSRLEEQLGIEADTDKPTLQEMREIWERYQTWPARVVDGMEPAECMVFEGAQGMLLDEKYGVAPYNTWTNTTFENADMLLDVVNVKDRVRIGCLRSYATRHGAGPMPTEDESLCGVLPEPHNTAEEFQGAFRIGWFDREATRRAVAIAGRVDTLAVSHLDYLPLLGIEENEFLESLWEFGPVGMRGRGSTARHRATEINP